MLSDRAHKQIPPKLSKALAKERHHVQFQIIAICKSVFLVCNSIHNKIITYSFCTICYVSQILMAVLLATFWRIGCGISQTGSLVTPRR